MTDKPSWREDKRGSTARGYGIKWQQARVGYLRNHPLCVMCEAEGRIERATVVDHTTPHKGDMKIFWDSANWQSLCASHHSSDKQRMELGIQERTKFTPDGRVIWKR